MVRLYNARNTALLSLGREPYLLSESPLASPLHFAIRYKCRADKTHTHAQGDVAVSGKGGKGRYGTAKEVVLSVS